jgi:hypothetical protein
MRPNKLASLICKISAISSIVIFSSALADCSMSYSSKHPNQQIPSVTTPNISLNSQNSSIQDYAPSSSTRFSIYTLSLVLLSYIGSFSGLAAEEPRKKRIL